jgi:glycosyltransferase involved in cell wall biosynthesis
VKLSVDGMKVSAIINNYNYGKFVASAINSVLNQTHEDLEVIIVDDGSSDESREVIRSFNDPRVRPIFQENGGQGEAILAGITASQGKLIALLDSDDEWLAHKLAACVEVYRARPSVSLIQHGWQNSDSEGIVLDSHSLPISGLYSPLEDYEKLACALPFAVTSCIAGPAEAFRKLRFNPTHWRIAADTAVVAGLSVLGECWTIPEALTKYRQHGANAESKNDWWDLISRRRRFYDCVNAQLNHLGIKGRRYRFESSFAYVGGMVARTKWFEPAGMWYRSLGAWQRLRGRSGWRFQ